MNENDREVLHKEIDLIQACITRMAHNSFLIKGWTIGIISIVLVIAQKEDVAPIVTLILLVPLVCFWWLDAFFLQTERKYRKMYAKIIIDRQNGNSEGLYDLNPSRFDSDVETQTEVMLSKTLKPFYGMMVLLVIVVFVAQLVYASCFTKLKAIVTESTRPANVCNVNIQIPPVFSATSMTSCSNGLTICSTGAINVNVSPVTPLPKTAISGNEAVSNSVDSVVHK